MKNIVIIGPCKSVSGYGVHTRMIIRSLLNREGVNLKIFPTRWGNTPETADIKDFENLLIYNLNYQPDVSIQVAIPNEFQRIGKFSIGVSAVTESSVCSLEFVQGTKNVDLVIVPSEFTKKVLSETKIERVDARTNQVVEQIECTTPIEVLFEGIDLDVFNKKNIVPIHGINEVKEDFAFLCVGAWLQGIIGEDRKNIAALVYTFLDLFKRKGNKKPALILKTHGAGFSEVDKNEVLNKLKQVNTMLRETGYKGQLPNVYLLNGELSDTEMNSLYNHPKVKAMVTFTHAEGFGIPMLEFTTTGKPVIAPNYSGQVDFLSKEHGAVLLPGQLTKIHESAANQWIIKDSEWFTVNYQFAAQILNDVFENYDKYLEKSRKHIQYTKDNFSMTKMGDLLINIINSKNITPTFNLPKLTKI